jgi:hypothetical protein
VQSLISLEPLKQLKPAVHILKQHAIKAKPQEKSCATLIQIKYHDPPTRTQTVKPKLATQATAKLFPLVSKPALQSKQTLKSYSKPKIKPLSEKEFRSKFE